MIPLELLLKKNLCACPYACMLACLRGLDIVLQQYSLCNTVDMVYFQTLLVSEVPIKKNMDCYFSNLVRYWAYYLHVWWRHRGYQYTFVIILFIHMEIILTIICNSTTRALPVRFCQEIYQRKESQVFVSELSYSVIVIQCSNEIQQI